MESMYYEKAGNKIVRCKLCPHNCLIRPGEIGLCGVRKNIDGSLVSLNHGKITSHAYDPIEKKPLYHFYPGSTVFSIGSFGCNLACDFCQNWEIAYGRPFTVEMGDEDIIALAKGRKSIGIAYTYNEPTISYEYVYNMAKLARKHGLKNILVTNGYINEAPLKELLTYIDAMNIDLKSMGDPFYRKICRGSLKPVQTTIEIASRYTHVELTNLVIEGENNSDREIHELGRWISSIDRSIPLHLSKYYPAYKMTLPATSYEALARAKEISKKYLDYVYIGNVPGIDNSTYCPDCSNQLVSRYRIGEIKGLKNNKCVNCGKTINVIN